MLCSVRRAAALVVAPALATLALVAVPSQATAAEPSSSGSAATWLAGQVPAAGLFSGSFGPDYGLSIDVALGLDAVGAGAPTVAKIRDALAADVNGYIAYSYTDGSGDHEGQSGGSTAKALVLAKATDSDRRAFGGVDLVNRLESLINADGRVISTFDGDPDPSYDNTYIQTLALEGLNGTENSSHAKLVAYLLGQQCSSGYFRGDIPNAPGIPLCSGDTPDTDATAQSVVALLGETAPATVAARQLAVNWLVGAQKPDGSFVGGTGTETANANSTGLAARALQLAGRTDAAAKAALWLRAHQVIGVAGCDPAVAADTGAVTYDDAALTLAKAGPMNAGLISQSIRTTAQALPGLLAAPAGTGTNVLFTAEYVRAGSTPSVGVTGAAPGDKLCATTPDGLKIAATADANGEAQFPVKLGTATATTVVTVANAAGIAGTATIKALGAKKLRITTKAKVRKGKTVKVLVRGLAPAESVVVKIGGKKKAGQANANGRFVAKVKAKKRGKTKVVVRGQFANRTATKTVRVVR